MFEAVVQVTLSSAKLPLGTLSIIVLDRAFWLSPVDRLSSCRTAAAGADPLLQSVDAAENGSSYRVTEKTAVEMLDNPTSVKFTAQ